MMHAAEKYAHDVLDGKIKTGGLVKLSVQRYFNDLKQAKKKGWVFDKASAESAIEYCSLLRHYKGKLAGEPFDLLPHQQFTFWNLYGWHLKDGRRRFRRSYCEMARKNGKTTESAARGLYRIQVDEPNGAQVYCAATKENQANILTTDAAGLLIGVPDLRRMVEVKKSREHITRIITVEEPSSYIRSIGRDSKTEDGRHASEIKIDEYHAWDSDYLLDVLEQSMKGRANPLTDITTTAGLPYVSGKDGVCYAFRKVCVDVLMGIKEDDSLFIMIHCLDDKDNLEDSSNWCKANPSLDHPGCVTLEDLKADFIKAKNEGERKWVEFLTKSLNKWTDAPTVWIQDSTWMNGDKLVKVSILMQPFNICKPEYLTNDYRKWFFGYDGGRTYDFSAWVGMSEEDEQGIVDVMPFYWIPEDTLEIREKEDRTIYRDWKAKKFLYTTPGNAISISHISEHIKSVYGAIDIALTYYDPALFAGEMIAGLVDTLGTDKFIPYSQAIWTKDGRGMSPPTKLLEGRLLSGKIRHGGHPVLRWNIRNSIIVSDANENIKVTKANAKQRVDGTVALVMAEAGLLAFKKGEIVSNSFEILAI